MRKSVQKIQNLKNENKKITVLTAYDYSMAKYIDQSDIDIILVGDSLGQVILGYDDTMQVTLDEMKTFVSAVSRGVKNSLLVADMPFGSFQINREETAKNAIELIRAGANAVKIEGANDYIIDIIKHLTQNAIPVMGHLGFTPMSINALGGHKIQAKDAQRTLKTLEDAKKLQDAGCFAIVLELMPKESAKFITDNLDIPTIGIGAGCDCSGQILVSDDLIGKFDGFKPKFARYFANSKEIILNAIAAYRDEVIAKTFPNNEESYFLADDEVKKLESYK